MTTDRDIERVLDHWFTERPTQVADRVFDSVAVGIARQPQRPAWRLIRRRATMNTYVKLVASVAAVLVVAVIGYNLLPGNSPGVGGPGPAPTPTASPIPTASPSASPTPTAAAVRGPMTLSTRNLDAGTYETRPFAERDIALTFTMPGGWEGFESWGLIGPGENGTMAPDGIGLGFMTTSGLYSDPCHWDAAGDFPQPGDIAVGPTVDDLVAALRANRAYVASAPADVTVDGYAGKQLELQLPSDVDFATCGSVMGSGGLLVWSPPLDAEGKLVNGGAMAGPLALGPGSRWRLRILDVEGTRIIILVGDYAGTPSADQAAAQAIVDSIQITP